MLGDGDDAFRCVRACMCVRLLGGGANTSSGGGARILFLICDHLASPGSCWPPPPTLLRCLWDFTERSSLLLNTHCHLMLTATRAHAHNAREDGNNIKTLSGGAPNSTRQRKGGWRDGFPPLCVAKATTGDENG